MAETQRGVTKLKGDSVDLVGPKSKVGGAAPEPLAAKKCKPCEGGVNLCTPYAANAQLGRLTGWQITHDGRRIRKAWIAKDFMAAMDFFNRIAELAENEGHHPDLHIEGFRNVRIELSTHAIGGLSENDFILAAKIDQLPISLKT